MRGLVTMVEREKVTEIYAEAYEAETGLYMSRHQFDRIEFEDYKIEYDSRSGKSIVTLFEFTDNDTFPAPDTVVIVKYDKDKCWRLV